MKRWYLLFMMTLLAGAGHLMAQDEPDGKAEEVATAAPGVAAAPTFPMPFRPGKIMDVVKTTEAVQWQSLRQILLQERFNPDEPVSQDSVVARQPAENSAYAILEIELDPGSSIGKHDYKLVRGGQEFKMLGIALGSKPFDPRQWEVTDSRIRPIKLLFEIPAESDDITLVMALPVTLRQAPLRIPLSPAESVADLSSTAAAAGASLDDELEEAIADEPPKSGRDDPENTAASEKSAAEPAVKQEEKKEEPKKAEDGGMADWF